MGGQPQGSLVVTPEGRLITVTTAPDRIAPATDADAAALLVNMVCYSGRVRVEGPGRFVTDVDVAWHPSWLGTEQARNFSISGATFCRYAPTRCITPLIPDAWSPTRSFGGERSEVVAHGHPARPLAPGALASASSPNVWKSRSPTRRSWQHQHLLRLGCSTRRRPAKHSRSGSMPSASGRRRGELAEVVCRSNRSSSTRCCRSSQLLPVRSELGTKTRTFQFGRAVSARRSSPSPRVPIREGGDPLTERGIEVGGAELTEVAHISRGKSRWRMSPACTI